MDRDPFAFQPVRVNGDAPVAVYPRRSRNSGIPAIRDNGYQEAKQKLPCSAIRDWKQTPRTLIDSPVTVRTAKNRKHPLVSEEEKVKIYEGNEAEDERRWYVAKSFFDSRSLVADTITSYDNFVNKGIQKLFEESEPLEVLPERTLAYKIKGEISKVVIRFGDPEFASKPEVAHEDREIMIEAETPTSQKMDMRKFSKGDRTRINWFLNTELSGGVDAGPNSGRGSDVIPFVKTYSRRKSLREKRKGALLRADHGKHGVGKSPNNGNSSLAPLLYRKIDDQTSGLKVKEVLHISPDLAEEDLDGPTGAGDTSVAMAEDSPLRVEEGRPPSSNGARPQKVAAAGLVSKSPTRERKRPKPEGSKNGEDYIDFEHFHNKRPAKEITNLGAEKKLQGDHSNSGKGYGTVKHKKDYRLLPVEACLRGMTYSSPLYARVTMEVHYGSLEVQSKNNESSLNPKLACSQVNVIQEKVLLGRIPVMVGSSLCHLRQIKSSIAKEKGDDAVHGECCMDPGGYFIIKGSEKVIVAQEERNGQKIWLSNFKGTWIASYTPRRKGFSNYNYQRTLVKLTPPGEKDDAPQKGLWPLFTVVIPGVEAIPLGLVLFALGVKNDQEIVKMICYEDSPIAKGTEEDLPGKDIDEVCPVDTELVQIIVPSLNDAHNQLEKAYKDWDQNSFETSKDESDVASYFIGGRSRTKRQPDQRLKQGQELLSTRLLPHIKDSRSKAYFLSYMARIVCFGFLGRERPTDRDDFKNKRLELSGEIMSHQFSKLMSHLQHTVRQRVQKHLSKNQEPDSVEKYVEEKVITRGFKTAFSSGIWMGRDVLKTSGIVFDLKRSNPISALCQLRELRQYVPPSTRVGDGARHLTFSQWGRICPIDTPDGAACGLVKNLALTGIVSCAGAKAPVFDCFQANGVKALESLTLPILRITTKVFVNGSWVGFIELKRTLPLLTSLRKLRKIPATPELHQMEVIYDGVRRELHVSTDAGRVLRPLLVVHKNKLNLNQEMVSAYISKEMGKPQERFDWFLQNGVIELLGVEEEEKALVAFHGADLELARQQQQQPTRIRWKFSHAEIHPSLILGLSASLIPFPHRNQSTRNMFEAHKHSKQAIGVYATNFIFRSDTSGHQLFYPQKQLVKTHAAECLRKPELFSGQNAIVAVACYTGYNQEDSIIMDQSALDRGMFRTQHYRTFKAEERSQHETFGKPCASEVDGRIRSFRTSQMLEEDGFPFIGCNVGTHDVLVGKVGSKAQGVGASCTKEPSSTRLKAHEKGRVDQVILAQNENGKKIAKVKLIETRMPEVGDKFATMHGQKGIVGAVFTQEDLPFTQEGIVPDIIINPHAFPSRQTLGQLCESALGKAVAKRGPQAFATPFTPTCTVEWITDVLHQTGYEGWGSETMYSGFTGQAMEAKIFIGTTFYQRLTHMVQDKIKYRSRGHVHPLTRQPVADRKRNGGVKFGEMERDCLIAHGAAATLQERTFHLSDYHEVAICRGCKQMAHIDADRVPTCRFCTKGTKDEIVKVEIPYSCKLLVQELQSMGISIGLDTEIIP
ncbi:hypothetical protein R1flu_005250 [Riccia fluitans]|uniref:DNA-directed RNA polymerase subunit beta n=1 Tax=Riccia fluitans TaxID=41844 RepID=A0ABD1YT58_9MARC